MKDQTTYTVIDPDDGRTLLDAYSKESAVNQATEWLSELYAERLDAGEVTEGEHEGEYILRIYDPVANTERDEKLLLKWRADRYETPEYTWSV